MNYIPTISNCATKVAGVLAYMVQYGCITHCALEYIGDFVIVNRLIVSALIYLNIQERLIVFQL